MSLDAVRGLLPGARDYAGLRASWRGDVITGLTVGVVALPLALAFGVATGLGAQAGLMTAIVDDGTAPSTGAGKPGSVAAAIANAICAACGARVRELPLSPEHIRGDLTR